MADYQLSYTGDQVNTAIGQIINKNITGTLTIETLDLTNSLAITQGGTGATTAAEARKNLGIKSCGTYDILPIAKGGTGKATTTEALKALGGISLTKLWENASSSSAFPNQKIILDTSEYDYVMVIANQSTSSNTRMAAPIITPNGNGGGIITAAGDTRRYFTMTTSWINFDTVYPTNVMTNCIPLYIFGIKGVL